MDREKINQSSSTVGLPIAPSIGPVLEAEHITSEEKLISGRVLFLTGLSVGVALLIGFIAQGLVALIELLTHVFFYGTFISGPASPVGNHLGWYVIFIPVIGGLIVGLMARFGSKAIRGHGIPEAMEQVLTNESRINPKITFWKPISSAFAIGTGGPFGAEGPIIATGAALGSLFGQVLKTTADERKILLTAGAAAGMAAIFGSPVAAVLLAIELLLFEFSPRSIIPVALGSVTGAAIHWIFMGTDAFFYMPDVGASGGFAITMYVLLGALMGVLSAGVTRLVYAIEDAFEKLPIHWMWWPAIGGLAVGIVGYFAPSTMGVGYENIRVILSGNAPLNILFVLCFLKFISWAIALGSGTSGGTLAPLFTIGGAFGALAGTALVFLFPGLGMDVRIAAIVGMAAMFAGASRALLASIVFAFETTLQPHTLLPLLGACTASYLVSFFMMKHTIMTEKIARRGIVTPYAYVPDMLSHVKVSQVAERNVHVLSGNNTLEDTRKWISSGKANSHTDRAEFPIVEEDGRLIGIVGFKEIFNLRNSGAVLLRDLIHTAPVTIYEDNSLRIAVDMMGRENIDSLPVVRREDKERMTGLITQKDIFSAYRIQSQDSQDKTQSINIRRKGIKVILLGRKFISRDKIG
jgi:H+/Cl- antiporter ClcA